MIRKFFVATAVLMAGSASALAADLPSRRPPPVYAPLPIFTWTGFYIGGDIGYTWGTDSHNNAAGNLYSFNTPQGEIGGVHVGYNYQINQFVVGLEGDADGLNFSNSNTLALGVVSFYESTRIPVEGSIRGRLGYAWDHLLFFATGGAAFGDIQHQYAVTAPTQLQVAPNTLVTRYDPNNPYSSTRVGWTVGGGVEYALSNNWSVRGEYRYTDFGHSSDYLASIGQTITNHIIEHRVTVGFSYKFDTFAPPAPVVAKY